MKINILTLFPEYFHSPFNASLLGKAIDNKIIDPLLVNIRDFAGNKHGKVDDAPYGGGSGMVMQIAPVENALNSLSNRGKVVLLTPRGYLLDQQKVIRLAKEPALTLICGHYEGFDERIAENLVDESICVGEFVLSGGEPAAAVVVDSVARLQPGFMGNAESVIEESFSRREYIEYPQYTRPNDYQGFKVPAVLTSGNHAEIEKWRLEQSKAAWQKFRSADTQDR